MADLEQLVCMTEDCSEEAATYCCVCKQLFCETHNEAHRDFVKILCSTHDVISAEEYQAERAENSRYCSMHEKTPIVLACENCYVPMCPKCFDDKTVSKTCQLGEGDKHCTRTVEQVVEKIQDEISELLSELKVTEMTNADELKERRKQFDEQMEENRTSLEKLDTKVQELHDMINDFAKETREKLVMNMKERKVLMTKWEEQLTEHQTSCQHAREMTVCFMKSHHIGIVKDQQKMKNDLIMLKSAKLELDVQILMSLTFKDEPLNIPIKLNEVYRMPKGLEFKENIATPGGTAGYSVQFVKNGRLLHSGRYQITGISCTPDISIGNNRINYSLCEHGSNLYVLQYYNNNYHVHILHMKNQTTRQSVIQFSNSRYQQQIAVNDAHIAISSYSPNSVKIYSTADNSHVLDVKHKCIGSRPWGVAVINNTIVVGDHETNQVSNLTISTNPIVKWTCTGIECPSAIRVCDESRVIMVASYSKKIYIVSYKGEKLSTLDVPECPNYIEDFAVYGKELAIADASAQIKLYEMKAE